MQRKNNKWITKGMKEASRNGDAKKLDKIQLGTNLSMVREKTIFDERFSTRNKLHVPDLTINEKVICEHDTVKIHGELSFESGRTLDRNVDYYLTRRPFFVINEGLAKHLKLDESALAEYLYYHTLSQNNAREQAEKLLKLDPTLSSRIRNIVIK